MKKRIVAFLVLFLFPLALTTRAAELQEDADGRELFWKRNEKGFTTSYHYFRGYGKGSGKSASRGGYGKSHGKSHGKQASGRGYGRGYGKGSGKSASKGGYGKSYGKSHGEPAYGGGYGRGTGKSTSTRKEFYGRGSRRSTGKSKASARANHGGKTSSGKSSSKRGYGEVAHRNPNTAPGPASGRNDIPTVTRPPGKGPTLAPASFSSIIRDKQLKLHWENGYRWQGETMERKWCMMYHYNGWPGSGHCWYDQIVKPCNPEEIYIATCNNDPRQRFNIIVLPNSDEAGNEIFLVHVPNTNLCFERNNNSIFLRECDSGSDLQQWIAINGRLTGEKFEITSASQDTHCVTQAHHPKAGEVVELFRCEVPRRPDHQTSFWNAIK